MEKEQFINNIMAEWDLVPAYRPMVEAIWNEGKNTTRTTITDYNTGWEDGYNKAVEDCIEQAGRYYSTAELAKDLNSLKK